MLHRIFVATIFLLSASLTFGQTPLLPYPDTTSVEGIRYHVGIDGLATTNARTPFWFHANQFGTIPLTAPAGLLRVGLRGLWGDVHSSRKPVYSISVEVIGQASMKTKLLLPEAYAGIRLGHAELYAGRRREINGLTDTLLTSGSVTWSGNALPITQIRLGTREYAPLKFTRNFVALNAFISHGWFANTDSMKNVLLHAKSIFVRLGKPEARIHLYGGINHFVQWGGYSPYIQDTFLANDGRMPFSWKTFGKVVWPTAVEDNADGQFSGIDTLNRVGNHLGSLDAGLEINGSGGQFLFYTQHFYEDLSGLSFKNFPDGLFGVRWKTKPRGGAFQLRQLTLEFITSLNRSGTGAKGHDDYFYNGQYLDGWVHRRFVIGTPLFIQGRDLPGAVRQKNTWFNRERPVSNNAVQSLHLGVYGICFHRITALFRTTISRYHALNTGDTYPQVSLGLELHQIPLPGKLQASVKVAYDTGEIFQSNWGVMLSCRKLGFLRW